MPCPFRRGIGTRTVEENDDIAFLTKRNFQYAGGFIKNAQNPDDRRWIYGLAERLIVEADVASGDGRAEFGAGDGETVDGFAELPHHVRFFGAAEIEAICCGDGARARSGNVARSFSDGMHSANARI